MRPGTLTGDVDFAENMKIEEARLVQSEHWHDESCTLFVGIWQWLDVGEWNSETGELEVGDEVTVHGEKAGEARVVESYCARVISTSLAKSEDMEPCYRIEDATGKVWRAMRSQLRRRVFVKQCHAGVTGDKKHDR